MSAERRSVFTESQNSKVARSIPTPKLPRLCLGFLFPIYQYDTVLTLHKARPPQAIMKTSLLPEGQSMYYNKVEICGVNTAKLPLLTSEEKSLGLWPLVNGIEFKLSNNCSFVI